MYQENFKQRIDIRHFFANSLLVERKALLENDDNARIQVAVVDSAYRSIMTKNMRKAYYSTPITSGKLLYDVCSQKGIVDSQGLNSFKQNKSDFFKEVITPNINGSLDAARDIASTYDGAVIAPALFEANEMRWSQAAYMALWLEIIDRDVTDLFLSPGAEYSNGAVMEMTQAMLMQLDLSYRDNIKIYDSKKENVGYGQMIMNIIDAANYIMNFSEPTEHFKALQKLRIAYLLNGVEIIQEKTNASSRTFIVYAFEKATKYLKENIQYLKDIPGVFLIENDIISQMIKDERLKTE